MDFIKPRLYAMLAILMLATAALADAPALRVCTYNVYDWHGNNAEIVGLVNEIDPDVLCTQEANGLADDLFVDVPVTIEANRAVVVGGVWVQSVHLSVGGGNHYAAMQSYIAGVPVGVPAVIAGDFNEDPSGVDTYRKAWDLLAMDALREAGWTRVDTPRQPNGVSFTHLGALRLDQIWLSPGLTWTACGMPDDPWSRGGELTSDHAPVWADVAIPEPPVLALLAVGFVLATRRAQR